MSCGVCHRGGSDFELLWLWYRPVAPAPVGPQAWKPPYATGVALEETKNKQTTTTTTKKQPQGHKGHNYLSSF